MSNIFSIAVARNIKIPCSFEATEILDAKAIELSKKCLAYSKLGKTSYVGEPFLYKRSIDARNKNQINLIYSVAVRISHEATDRAFKEIARLKNVQVIEIETPEFVCHTKKLHRPIVAGFGPSGMFCALALAKAGLKPLVIERGDDVDTRAQKVDAYWNGKALDENSNVQFGEGGAGTFSDGKLLTRISDPLCSYVIEEFVRHGAPKEISYLAKPHIGTDNLRKIVKNIRNEIIYLGGQVSFGTRLDGIVCSSDESVNSVVLSNGEKIPCSALFLCIGHSARDTVKALMPKGLYVEPKPFSVGVRIEHLQTDIDSSLYGSFAGAPALSKAQYTLSRRFADRAVYSFCMCPGGVVVASASQNDEIVTNGMSYFARDGLNANSALAVSVNPYDYGNTVDGAIEFQKSIERAAFEKAGGDGTAPIQCLGDFLNGTLSNEPKRILPSYTGKTKLTNASEVLPRFVNDSLKCAIQMFEQDIEGFSCKDAVLTFPETRTSSPFKIPRDEEFVSVSNAGIYPVGEGAGYAGGITSAAVDGLKAALKYLESGN